MATTPITKHDRILRDLAALAAALPGTWAIASARSRWRHEFILHGPGDESLLAETSPGRRWGYRVYPFATDGPRTHGLHWHLGDTEVPHFPVGTPATDVAALIEEHLLPLHRQRHAAELAARAHREETRARQRAAVARTAHALGATEPRILSSLDSWHCRVTDLIEIRVSHVHPVTDHVELRISLPVDEAIMLAPHLRHLIEPAQVPAAVSGS